MLNLNKIVLQNEEQCGFYNGRLLLICQTCDDGIDYTIYDDERRLSDVDGGQFDYPDDEDFKGYTVEELFDFVRDTQLGIEFDENSVELDYNTIDVINEKVDEISNIMYEVWELLQ